jgi:predicted extracellular nuclease
MGRQDIIRVGTFNLLNLTLPETTFYGKQKYTAEEFAKKKEWINQQLDNMNVDICGFQELFHVEALRNVLNENPNYENARVVVGENAEGLPSVGLLSKYPITDVQVINSFPSQLEIDGMIVPFTRFSRPVLKCRVEVRPGVYFIVIVAHLKSKRPMIADGVDRHDPLEIGRGQARSLLLRAAEAAALREVLMEVLKDRNHPVIVIGDLNDTHTSVTTRIISGDPPYRRLPMEHKIEIWDTLLYHAKDIQARVAYHDTYYTHLHNGHYEALDHIMVSQELVKENPKHIGRIGYVQIYNDHLIDDTFSNERVPCWKSDHAQVVVSIELKD